MILAPLRGVTIRTFRETFAEQIAEAGFTEAVTPFIPAMAGLDPLKDRELREQGTGNREQGTGNRERGTGNREQGTGVAVTPQFIGKDPQALRACLERVKAAGFVTADLNCGCPFPMVRNKGRGSGLLRTPDVLRQMLEVGCEVMGLGKFSIKARLGVDRNDELLALMPMINAFPLRHLTVHARNARQMYEGTCDTAAFEAVAKVSNVPIVYNGDIPFPVPRSPFPVPRSPFPVPRSLFPVPCSPFPVPCSPFPVPCPLMLGRGFVRYLGTREDAGELLRRYIAASQAELCGDRPVLGRMKELLAYWKDLPQWKRRWDVMKICRSVDELRAAIW